MSFDKTGSLKRDEYKLLKDKQMERNILNHIYQKGYSDGYRRRDQILKTTQDNEDATYTFNVFLIIVLFSLFLLGILYTYKPNDGINSHYEGDCLIDLATTYTSKCLDN